MRLHSENDQHGRPNAVVLLEGRQDAIVYACRDEFSPRPRKQNSVEFREQLQRVIADTQIVKAVPAPKEIVSDISWAKLHPLIANAFWCLQRSCPMNGCS